MAAPKRSVFPEPKSSFLGNSHFPLSTELHLWFSKEFQLPAKLLVEKLLPHYYIQHCKVKLDANLTYTLNPKLADEEYTLLISKHKIDIRAGGVSGAFCATQTLLQLFPAWIHTTAYNLPPNATIPKVTLPCYKISDYPKYSWRGCHLDVSRHFFEKTDVLKFIDAIAMHKFNVLHLHLTDDQGWRFQVKEYPKLTEVGGFRKRSQEGAGTPIYDNRPHGGFYTQEDLKEMVAFAKSRGVEIVPEIDIPGHCLAAIAAYPELGVDYADGKPQNLEVWDTWGVSNEILSAEESTFTFLETVFKELCEIFPSKVIMIGGDECPVDKWEASPRIKERMKELGVKNTAELRNYFIKRVSSFLTSKRRETMCWNEVVKFDPPLDTIIANWTDPQSANIAANKGYRVLNMPQQKVYLDWRQTDDPNEPIPVASPITLEDVFNFDPADGIDKKEKIIGSQGALWSEHFDNIASLHDAAFPRLCALAESLWGHEDRDFETFERALTRFQFERLDALGIGYRGLRGVPLGLRRPGVPGRD